MGEMRVLLSARRGEPTALTLPGLNRPQFLIPMLGLSLPTRPTRSRTYALRRRRRRRPPAAAASSSALLGEGSVACVMRGTSYGMDDGASSPPTAQQRVSKPAHVQRAEALGIVQGFGFFAVKCVPPPLSSPCVVRRLGGCSAASASSSSRRLFFAIYYCNWVTLGCCVDLGGPLGKGCCALLGDRGSTAQKFLKNHRPTQQLLCTQGTKLQAMGEKTNRVSVLLHVMLGGIFQKKIFNACPGWLKF
jgi:hypothetical protein